MVKLPTRSYYINRWRSMYLTTPQGTDRLQEKKDDVAEAEAQRDTLGKEADEVRQEVKRLGSQLSKVEGDLGRVKKRLLDSKSKLKVKEQQRDKVGNKEELGRLEAKIKGKQTAIEKAVEVWRKVQEEVMAVEVNLKELEAQHAAAQAIMGGLSEQSLLLRQRKEKLDAAYKTLEVKISRSSDKLKVLDQEISLQLEDITKCQTLLLAIEGKAREMTGGEELEPEESLEKLEAKIENIMKERVERGQTDYGTEALKTYTELSSRISLKIKRIDYLKLFSKNLEDQMGSRRELFQTLRDKVVEIIVRPATGVLSNIDHQKKNPNIDQISTTQHFIDQISTAKVP